MTFPSTTSGGYYCEMCHGWVPYGSPHICPSYKSTTMNDNNIISILERIAIALEKIAKERYVG